METTPDPVPAFYADLSAWAAAQLMPNLDSFAAESPEARDLLPQGLGDRADHRHGLHLLESHPGGAHDVRRHAELRLAIDHEAVLLGDLGAPHRVTPGAS